MCMPLRRSVYVCGDAHGTSGSPSSEQTNRASGRLDSNSNTATGLSTGPVGPETMRVMADALIDHTRSAGGNAVSSAKPWTRNRCLPSIRLPKLTGDVHPTGVLLSSEQRNFDAPGLAANANVAVVWSVLPDGP